MFLTGNLQALINNLTVFTLCNKLRFEGNKMLTGNYFVTLKKIRTTFSSVKLNWGAQGDQLPLQTVTNYYLLL